MKRNTIILLSLLIIGIGSLSLAFTNNVFSNEKKECHKKCDKKDCEGECKKGCCKVPGKHGHQMGFMKNMEPEQKANCKTALMARKLDLEESEKKELNIVNKNYYRKIKEHKESIDWENVDWKDEEARKKVKGPFKTFRKERNTDLKKLLGEEKYAKLKDLRNDKKGKCPPFCPEEDCKKAFDQLQNERKEFSEELTDDEKETLADVRKNIPPHFKKMLKDKKCKPFGPIGGCHGNKGRKSCHGKKGKKGHHCKGHKKGEHHKGDDMKGHHDKKGHGKHKKKGFKVFKEKTKPLRDIAQNHKEQLFDIFKEMKEMRISKMKERINELPKACRLDEEKFEKFISGHSIQENDKFFNKKATHFLLMNPEKKSEEARKLKTYPNPAEKEATISYEVLKTGDVKISVLNQSGKVVKTVLNEKKEKGSYEREINFSDLEGRYYMIKVTDNKGSSSSKVVMRK